ncbi:polysaccharide deacetylase family protein [Sphingobium yanoikuyae]|uniref:polysaccharide deacetylase family protein n=1 Tax=Sphingobium yanoikuyae TaxID=13690 RepID=UPI003D164062
MRGEVELPNNSVLVTIDDGDPSVYDLALPILRQYEVPAVLYTLAGSVPGFPVMSDEHIKSVHRAGITIGSHGLTHRSMAQLSLADARHELVSSKHRLESLIGVPVTSFAYPFGTKSHVSWDVVQLAIEAGYTTAVTSVHGRLTQQQGHPLLLPRVKIEAGDPNWLFEHLCRGSMDWWRLVDEGPFRRLSGVGDGHFVGAR